MKYIIRKIFLLVLAANFAGCQWLDVSTRTEVRSEDLFNTEEGFWEALTGIYIGMGQRSVYGGYLTWEAIEFMAWEHANGSTQGSSWYYLQRGDYTAPQSATFINAVWSKLYNVIAEANYLLYALDEYGHILAPDVYRTIKGEALALRAYCHFDLIRLFAPGGLAADKSPLDEPCIPYVTKYSKHVAQQKTYRETLAMVMDDIDEAIACLDETDVPVEGRVFSSYANMNHRAALLLKARVAQWAGDPKTLEYALDLIEVLEAGSSMWAVDMSQGNAGIMMSELLFYINAWNLKEYMEFAYSSHMNSTMNQNMLIENGANFVSGDLFELDSPPSGVAASDMRYRNWYEMFRNEVYDINGMITVKVRNEGNNAASIAPLMRISEAYLIAAECYATTDKPKAVEYVNFLRRKRNNPPEYLLPENISEENLLAIIGKEYRREFPQEGQLFYFYKRKGVVQIPGSRAGDMTREKYTLPYPETEYEFGRE